MGFLNFLNFQYTRAWLEAVQCSFARYVKYMTLQYTCTARYTVDHHDR